jgi:glycosyltransferase involved in cell wall biosynthesis
MNGDQPKYSIITTSKGRVTHLAQSLPAMMKQPHSEVIVVDYDCPDGTSKFVADHFPDARIVRQHNAPGFNASHARNLGALQARGEILVFVDADVILAGTFVDALERVPLKSSEFGKFADAVVPSENSLQGTCAVRAEHFRMVGGYDEVLKDYGGEDLDLYDRLALARVDRRVLQIDQIDGVIEHSEEERRRFLGKGARVGFLIGKVYRVAKGMILRINGTLEADLQLRQSVYDEICRLVGNMRHMPTKHLRLEIKFPDSATGGLHKNWEFTRSIVVRVDLRGAPPQDQLAQQ